MRKVLILNGTISEIPIIRKTQELGYFVVTTGNDPTLPGHAISDKYINEDYSNQEAILKLVIENKIDGIISCANDFGVITSSYVAEKMGWSGHDTYENSKLMHHKDKLRDYFKRMGFPCPEVEIFTDIENAMTYCRKCEYPVMVKANDLTGGKGIFRADNYEEAEKALKESFSISRDKHIIIEQFFTGVQQSIVVFLVNKRIVVTSSSNIYCMRNPYLVQAETYPAENFEAVKDELHGIIHKMADDLNLVDGIFSFQYFVHNGHPYVIDMMRRCFGNETLLLADVMTGFPWEEAYIKSSLGIDCDSIEMNAPEANYCGHYGLMAGQNGILKSYNIPQDIENRIFKKTVNINIGEKISDSMTQKVAHIYFTYDDMEQMNKEILDYNGRIEICVEDE